MGEDGCDKSLQLTVKHFFCCLNYRLLAIFPPRILKESQHHPYDPHCVITECFCVCVFIKMMLNGAVDSYVIQDLSPFTEYKVSLSAIYKDETESNTVDVLENTCKRSSKVV